MIDLPKTYKPPYQVKVTCLDYHLTSKRSTAPSGPKGACEGLKS